MTDTQQSHMLAGLQPQGATTEDADSVGKVLLSRRGTETTNCSETDRESPEQSEATLPISPLQQNTVEAFVQEFEQAAGDFKEVLSPRGAGALAAKRGHNVEGLVREFEQAVGGFKEVLSPRGAGTPDKLATPSTLPDSSQTSPTDSSPTRARSPCVRMASSGNRPVSLVTEAMLDSRIEQVTLAMHANLVRTIQEEITSFDSTLQGSFDALEARVEALEKKGGGHAQELERHEHDHRALADQIDGLQRQSAEQDQRVAQRLEQLGQRLAQRLDQLGHTGGQDNRPLLGPRLDKMSQDQQEIVGALELANQQMVVRLGTLQEQANMLHDSLKAQEQECEAFQKELGRRVDDEMKLLKGKVDAVTHRVQDDLMGLHSKLCTDLENLQADQKAVPEEAADDDCRWEVQYRTLEIETAASKAHPEVTEAQQPPRILTAKRAMVFQHTLPAEVTGDSEPPPSPQPATLDLAEFQRKIDQKLDMCLRPVDEFITRHEANLQQLGEVGNQYSAVQQCVDDLRGEIGSVRGDLDELRKSKVLKHICDMQALFEAEAPGGMEQ